MKHCAIKFSKLFAAVAALVVFIGFAGLHVVNAAEKPGAKPAAKEPAKEAAPAPVEKPKPAAQPKTSTILDPKDPRSILYLNTKGDLAGTGDPSKSGPASEALKMGQGWHPAALASTLLPKDKYGLVNWAKAVKDNLIVPRPSLEAGTEDMPPLDMNVLIETKSDFINDVVYPHYIHTWWLKCEICHPGIFIPQKGGNNMTMVEIVGGKFCGRCHGKVAFPLTDCTRCHVSPKKTAGK